MQFVIILKLVDIWQWLGWVAFLLIVWWQAPLLFIYSYSYSSLMAMSGFSLFNVLQSPPVKKTKRKREDVSAALHFHTFIPSVLLGTMLSLENRTWNWSPFTSFLPFSSFCSFCAVFCSLKNWRLLQVGIEISIFTGCGLGFVLIVLLCTILLTDFKCLVVSFAVGASSRCWFSHQCQEGKARTGIYLYMVRRFDFSNCWGPTS